APWKDTITTVDKNPLDLRQAFVTYRNDLAGGELKARVGRQEMAFDLQRFVSVRDGPNVRQASDAAWLDRGKDLCGFLTFWRRPVEYGDGHPFDDHANWDLQYGVLRAERQDVGPGELSAYYSRFHMDGAEYLDANGDEARNILDVRYAGNLEGFDWDLEGM